jgi:hypothetical protein
MPLPDTTVPESQTKQPLLPLAPRDVERRRREMALTTRWLRELRGASDGDARPTARFTRPAKH